MLIRKFRFILDQRRASTSFFVMHINRAFSEQPTPFPHIPFCYCNFAIHFNNLLVNFFQPNFLAFKNCIVQCKGAGNPGGGGGASFSEPVQIGPGADRASYTVGIESFSVVLRPVLGVTQIPSYSTELKKDETCTSAPLLCLHAGL